MVDITGYEASGTNDPSVVLWQYGQEQEIARYYGSHGKVTRFVINADGCSYDSCD